MLSSSTTSRCAVRNSRVSLRRTTCRSTQAGAKNVAAMPARATTTVAPIPQLTAGTLDRCGPLLGCRLQAGQHPQCPVAAARLRRHDPRRLAGLERAELASHVQHAVDKLDVAPGEPARLRDAQARVDQQRTERVIAAGDADGLLA